MRQWLRLFWLTPVLLAGLFGVAFSRPTNSTATVAATATQAAAQRQFCDQLVVNNGLIVQPPRFVKLVASDLPAGLGQPGPPGPVGPQGPPGAGALPPGLVDASANGVTGGGTDVHVAFQTLVNTVSPGVTIVLPPGNVYLGTGNSATGLVDLTSMWSGSKFSIVSFSNTTISGQNDGGPLLGCNASGANITRGGFLQGCTVKNTSTNALACGLQCEQMQGLTIRDCGGQGQNPYVVGKLMPTNLGVLFDNVLLTGNLTTWPNSVGIAANGQGRLSIPWNATQWHFAVRLSNQWDIASIQFQTNDTGLQIGIKPDGTSGKFYGRIGYLSSEADLTAVDCQSPDLLTIDAMNINGHNRSTPVDPGGGTATNYGLKVQKGGALHCRSSSIAGGFTVAGVWVNPAIGSKSCRFENVTSGATIGSPWIVAGTSTRTSDTNSGLDGGGY
jgi:hypothetical protein